MKIFTELFQREGTFLALKIVSKRQKDVFFKSADKQKGGGNERKTFLNQGSSHEKL
jgi:hypothetical protein